MGARFTVSESQEIFALRRSGKTIKQIASETGLGFEGVKTHLRRQSPFQHETIRLICEKLCAEREMSFEDLQIAVLHGCNRNTSLKSLVSMVRQSETLKTTKAGNVALVAEID